MRVKNIIGHNQATGGKWVDSIRRNRCLTVPIMAFEDYKRIDRLVKAKEMSIAAATMGFLWRGNARANISYLQYYKLRKIFPDLSFRQLVQICEYVKEEFGLEFEITYKQGRQSDPDQWHTITLRSIDDMSVSEYAKQDFKGAIGHLLMMPPLGGMLGTKRPNRARASWRYWNYLCLSITGDSRINEKTAPILERATHWHYGALLETVRKNYLVETVETKNVGKKKKVLKEVVRVDPTAYYVEEILRQMENSILGVIDTKIQTLKNKEEIEDWKKAKKQGLKHLK